MEPGKKLQMERLSPIPILVPSCSSSQTFCNTPISRPSKQSFKTPKNAYSIEAIVSPEVESGSHSKSGLAKSRKNRNYVSRKSKTSTKKSMVSTPLSGLINKQMLYKTPRTTPISLGSTEVAETNCNDFAPTLTIEDVPTSEIENVNETTVIASYSSPQKSCLPFNIRHSEAIISRMSFPEKTLPNTTLGSIISKTTTSHNISLNNSLAILKETEVSDDEEHYAKRLKLDNTSKQCDFIPASIECFASPSSKKNINSNEISFSTNEPCSNTGFKQNFKTSSEMCGSDRKKKRKRALDFSLYAPKEAAIILNKQSDVSRLPLLEDDTNPVLQEKRSPKLQCTLSTTLINNEIECDSDTDSVIEGTPKSSFVSLNVKKSDYLSGFITSSSLPIENEHVITPVNTKITLSEFHDSSKMGIDEHLSHCGPIKEFVVINHDTSSSSIDSVTEVVIEEVHEKSVGHNSPAELSLPSIDDRHRGSPPKHFEKAKPKIQIFESPLKENKQFSEAINIGAFGSPDCDQSSNSENPLDEIPEVSEEIVNCSTTQEEEFVDESEQVKPGKRKKKGSLVERVTSVISRIDASKSLFEYESKNGLRPVNSKFVSSSLVVCKKTSGENSTFILVCKPLKLCGNVLQNSPDESSIIAVIANKLTPDISVGSVVTIHFPISIVYCSSLNIPYVLAGNQLVLQPTEPKIEETQLLNVDDALIKAFNFSKDATDEITRLKVVNSSTVKTLEDASLCQHLVNGFSLMLKVLHVLDTCPNTQLKKIVALCSDSKNKCCWIEFTTDRDIKRAAALEMLHILRDGCQINIEGFHVSRIMRMNTKEKSLVQYCSSEPTMSDLIYKMQPALTNWVVSSSGAPRRIDKLPTTIDDLLLDRTPNKRYLLEVHHIKPSDNYFSVMDTKGLSIIFVPRINNPLFHETHPPFFLDGIYWSEGKLFSDEYSKLVLKR